MDKKARVKSLLKNSRYFPIAVFLLLFFLFYAITEFTIGITTQGGMYNRFVATHLDWFAAFRSFLLQGAKLLLKMMGHEVQVIEPYRLKIADAGGVRMVQSCVGMGIISFWWAMILAFPQTTKNKLIYFTGGTAIIIILNIIRIAAVTLVLSSDWGKTYRNIDHHLLFNIVVYAMLFYMLYKWFNIRETKLPAAHNNISSQTSIYT